ncbi:MAG TPA: hypothetical protein DCZ62_03375 [Ruminococcus sp.]|nr:hypothetical protein [Ruminococcus sp.]
MISAVKVTSSAGSVGSSVEPLLPEELLPPEVFPEDPLFPLPDEEFPELLPDEEPLPEELFPEEVFPEVLFPEELFPEELLPEELFPEEEVVPLEALMVPFLAVGTVVEAAASEDFFSWLALVVFSFLSAEELSSRLLSSASEDSSASSVSEAALRSSDTAGDSLPVLFSSVFPQPAAPEQRTAIAARAANIFFSFIPILLHYTENARLLRA